MAIARYHQLYKEVERDRNDDEQNEQFDHAMLEEMKKCLSKKKQQQLAKGAVAIPKASTTQPTKSLLVDTMAGLY